MDICEGCSQCEPTTTGYVIERGESPTAWVVSYCEECWMIVDAGASDVRRASKEEYEAAA